MMGHHAVVSYPSRGVERMDRANYTYDRTEWKVGRATSGAEIEISANSIDSYCGC
jgi:hypothetical protein